MMKSCWDTGYIVKDELTELADGLDPGGVRKKEESRITLKVFELSSWVNNDVIN